MQAMLAATAATLAADSYDRHKIRCVVCLARWLWTLATRMGALRHDRHCQQRGTIKQGHLTTYASVKVSGPHSITLPGVATT
jgi:hypothetical protein